MEENEEFAFTCYMGDTTRKPTWNVPVVELSPKTMFKMITPTTKQNVRVAAMKQRESVESKPVESLSGETQSSPSG